MSVNHYRVFCETEQGFGYVWSTYTPTVCPNNIEHTINNNSITIIDQINTSQTEITNLTSDNTETLQVIEKTVVFNLPSFLGVSPLRNNVITANGGSVTASLLIDSEIKINCTGSYDEATLRSIDRGLYIPGLICEVGLAIRIPSNALTGNQTLTWGYFTDTNGFYFKLTSTELQVCILNNNVEICISRQNFNSDRLDGNGKSGHLLDFSKGNIFLIQFSWYGFGLVSFQILGSTKTSKQSPITLHEYQTVGQTSTRLPNLPIQIQLKNNGTVANTDIYVAGRQFSILGRYESTIREVSMYKYLCAVSNEVFLPIFSIKRKVEFMGTCIRLSEIYMKCSVDCEVKIMSACTLTNSNWVENPHNDESACLVDLSSTSSVNGLSVYTMIVFANEPREHSFDNVIQLNETEPLTILCKSLTGETGSITIKIAYCESW